MSLIRKNAALVIAVLSILAAGYDIYSSISSRDWINEEGEMVSKWDERLQPLREALPKDVNQVGYVDTSIINNTPSKFDGEEFFLMQYSVAPVALDHGFEQDWVIINTDNDTDINGWLNSQAADYEIQSFGFGLYLIRILER